LSFVPADPSPIRLQAETAASAESQRGAMKATAADGTQAAKAAGDTAGGSGNKNSGADCFLLLLVRFRSFFLG